jgi:hypothetical protein
MATQPQPDPGRATGIPHSLRAETAVLPFEYPEEFHQLKQQLEAEFQPVGAREALLFDELVMAAWDLRRLRIYDVAVNARLFETARTDSPNASCMERIGAMLVEDGQGKRVLGYLLRLENAQRRAFHDAVRELERLQTIRRAARPAPPRQDPELALVGQTPPAQPHSPDPQPAKLASVVQTASRPSPQNDTRAWRL